MPYDDELKNPRNMAGARRLLDNPKALDEAMDDGLGAPKRGLSARGFSDAEIRKLKRDAGNEDR